MLEERKETSGITKFGKHCLLCACVSSLGDSQCILIEGSEKACDKETV